MNKKQTIRINENQLRKIVTESVKKYLKEDITSSNDPALRIRAYADKISGMAERLKNYLVDRKTGITNVKAEDLANKIIITTNRIQDEISELNGYQQNMTYNIDMNDY